MNTLVWGCKPASFSDIDSLSLLYTVLGKFVIKLYSSVSSTPNESTQSYGVLLSNLLPFLSPFGNLTKTYIVTANKQSTCTINTQQKQNRESNEWQRKGGELTCATSGTFSGSSPRASAFSGLILTLAVFLSAASRSALSEPPLLLFVSSLPQQLPSLTALPLPVSGSPVPNQHKKKIPKFGH